MYLLASKEGTHGPECQSDIVRPHGLVALPIEEGEALFEFLYFRRGELLAVVQSEACLPMGHTGCVLVFLLQD